MAAILDEQESYQDDGGNPIVNGFVFFGTVNSDTENNLLPIFSDRALTVSITNPQRTDSFGRTVNKVWISSAFSKLVRDVNNVQIYSDPDAGGFTSSVGTLLLKQVAGIDTLTSVADPTISTYVDQQEYSFKALNNNTGAVTMNVDSIGAITIKNEGVDLTAGRLVAGTIYVIIFNTNGPIFQLASSSGGDMNGPAGAVNDNIPIFDGTTGKSVKDSGFPISAINGDFKGPASSVLDNIVSFGDTTGKLGKDSGVGANDVVTGPASATDGNVPTLDATGKVLADSGKLATDLVTGPASASAGNVAAIDATGKVISDGGKVAADLVTGPASATVGNVPQLDATGKVLTDSGKLAADIVTGPVSAVVDNIVLFSNVNGKIIKDSGVPLTSLGDVDGPVSAVADNLASFDGTTGKKIKDSGKLTSDVVTGPASATNGNVPTLDATGKVLADSGKLGADLVTGPGSATAGNVAAIDATGKVISDGGKIAADLVTGPGSATNGNVPTLDATGKVLADSGKLASDLVEGPVSAIASRLADFSGTSGKIIKDSGKLTADVVTGPGSAVASRLADFSGTSGKVIKDSGKLTADVVTGPASAVDMRLASFNGTTGKIIEDSGILISEVGKLVKIGLATSNANTNTTSLIPVDDTVPQISEGTQFLSLAYTPLFSDSTLRIECNLFCACNANDLGQLLGYAVMICRTGVNDCLNAGWAFAQFDEANNSAVTQFFYDNYNVSVEESSGSTSARTYTVRAGVIIGSSTLNINGQLGNREFGAIPKSWLRVTEIRA